MNNFMNTEVFVYLFHYYNSSAEEPSTGYHHDVLSGESVG